MARSLETQSAADVRDAKADFTSGELATYNSVSTYREDFLTPIRKGQQRQLIDLLSAIPNGLLESSEFAPQLAYQCVVADLTAACEPVIEYLLARPVEYVSAYADRDQAYLPLCFFTTANIQKDPRAFVPISEVNGLKPGGSGYIPNDDNPPVWQAMKIERICKSAKTTLVVGNHLGGYRESQGAFARLERVYAAGARSAFEKDVQKKVAARFAATPEKVTQATERRLAAGHQYRFYDIRQALDYLRDKSIDRRESGIKAVDGFLEDGALYDLVVNRINNRLYYNPIDYLSAQDFESMAYLLRRMDRDFLAAQTNPTVAEIILARQCLKRKETFGLKSGTETTKKFDSDDCRRLITLFDELRLPLREIPIRNEFCGAPPPMRELATWKKPSAASGLSSNKIYWGEITDDYGLNPHFEQIKVDTECANNPAFVKVFTLEKSVLPNPSEHIFVLEQKTHRKHILTDKEKDERLAQIARANAPPAKPKQEKDISSTNNNVGPVCLSYRPDGSLVCTAVPLGRETCPGERNWRGQGICRKLKSLKVNQLGSDWSDLKASYEYRRGESDNTSDTKINACFARCMADCDRQYGASSITKKETYGRSACQGACSQSCP